MADEKSSVLTGDGKSPVSLSAIEEVISAGRELSPGDVKFIDGIVATQLAKRTPLDRVRIAAALTRGDAVFAVISIALRLQDWLDASNDGRVRPLVFAGISGDGVYIEIGANVIWDSIGCSYWSLDYDYIRLTYMQEQLLLILPIVHDTPAAAHVAEQLAAVEAALEAREKQLDKD